MHLRGVRGAGPFLLVPAGLIEHFCSILALMVSGDLLREARRRARLTQAELGERTGKPQSVIGRWERGEVLPSFETLRELIRACGFDLTYRMAARDDSNRRPIEEMLALSPGERVLRSAAAAERNRAIRRTAAAARND